MEAQNSLTARIETRRNAPSLANHLSRLVDSITLEIEDARAVGLHAIADELDRARQIVVEAAITAWRAEGRER